MPFAAGTKESFLGAFLENIIYGLYLSAFIECCTLFWRRRKPQNGNQFYLMFTAGLMFLLITIRCIIDTYRCVVTFNTVDADFGLPNSTLGLVTNACWFYLTPLADFFIIFRTYVVWNGSWPIIVLPLILGLANLGSSFWVTVALVQLNTDGPEIWGNIVWKSLNTFLSLSLATNVICTALISFRILQIHRRVTATGVTSVGPRFGIKLVSIIVESAAMYTLLLVGILISNSVESFVNFVFFDCTPPTIGLVFSYIIIRVSRGTSYGDDTDVPSGMDFGHRTTASERFELGHNHNVRSGSQGEVQVRLEREVHEDSEDCDSGGKYSGKSAV
ncbi:hypothetical protein B0H16DRAFT_1525416 [Mycena metata]|uniref:Uncharacterized protein n=1 Tax=Mycena metata TaxID=1033252 RepID=A0AAD7NKR4_9AGAR|nr:hypothetical protein B0H16DRAFT_1525416 [Mycena metata]